MKKYLIAGAGGFLGSEIVHQLKDRKEVQIIALTSQESKMRHLCLDTENIMLKGRNAVFEQEIDLSDVDVLINCAFPRNVDGSQMAGGLQYISNLLEIAVAGGVKAVINVSSQSVYSQSRIVSASETTELSLETKYAVGKYATELMTNCISRDIPHTNIRMASLIGAGFDQRLVNKFVQQVLAGNNLCIRGGKQLFGFLDVRDAASAVIVAAENSDWSEVYNLGPERSYSLLEIAECVQNVADESGLLKTEIELAATDDWQNSDVNSAKFRKQFNWEEQFDLKETIRWILNVCKEREMYEK